MHWFELEIKLEEKEMAQEEKWKEITQVRNWSERAVEEIQNQNYHQKYHED